MPRFFGRTAGANPNVGERVAAEFSANGVGLNMLDSSVSAQARIAVEAIRGGDTLFSSRWVPRYLDTDPPVAAVGWMETDANDAWI
jgi:hypothetical protein